MTVQTRAKYVPFRHSSISAVKPQQRRSRTNDTIENNSMIICQQMETTDVEGGDTTFGESRGQPEKDVCALTDEVHKLQERKTKLLEPGNEQPAANRSKQSKPPGGRGQPPPDGEEFALVATYAWIAWLLSNVIDTLLQPCAQSKGHTSHRCSIPRSSVP